MIVIDSDLAVRLVIHGQPIAQPRPKATTIGRHARMYTPDNGVAAYKDAIRLAWRNAKAEPFDGPVFVRMVFAFERPQGLTRKTLPNPWLWKETKPDADNLEKAVLDALTWNDSERVLGAWRDDACVVGTLKHKVVCAGGVSPFTAIAIHDARTLVGSPNAYLLTLGEYEDE